MTNELNSSELKPSELTNCPSKSEEAIDLLLDYSAGRLDAQRTLLLERHMDGCADCAHFRHEQAAVWQALDAWEPAPVSIDFNRRLWQRIDADASSPWYSKAGLRQLVDALRLASTKSAMKPAIPLAVALLAIAGGFLMDHPGARTVQPNLSDSSRVSISEADQVERTLDDIQLLHQFDFAGDEQAGKTAKTM